VCHGFLQKSHYTFNDRGDARGKGPQDANAVLNVAAIDRWIESLKESSVAKEVRRFILKTNAPFYQSYVGQSSVDILGKSLVIKAPTAFARDKIEESFFGLVSHFLKEKHDLSLQLSVQQGRGV